VLFRSPASCLEVRNFRANEIGRVLVPVIRSDSPGYAFGLIIEACTKHQEKHKPTQADPIQLSSHYLASPGLVPYEIRIRTLKSGRSYTNIYAGFRQEVGSLPRHLPHRIELKFDYPGKTQSYCPGIAW